MKKSIDLAFRCTNCDFKSNDVKSTQQHLIDCSNSENIFECFVCDDSFRSEKVLSKHHLDIHDLQDDYEEPLEESSNAKSSDEFPDQQNSNADLSYTDDIKKELIEQD